jgi:uncharacterized repeat protein (TIGR01451 family)
MLKKILFLITLVIVVSPFASAQALGTINTVAGGVPNNVPALSVAIGFPTAVVKDSSGNLYMAVESDSIAEGGIFKVDANGTLTTVVGSATLFALAGGNNGDGGPATNATLGFVTGLFVDSQQNLYISDLSFNTIRKVTASTGIITTVAGGGTGCTAQTDAFGDGCPATSAILSSPYQVFVDANQNIYIADSGNARIREVVASTGLIQTVVGGGAGCTAQTDTVGDNCSAVQSTLSGPIGVYLDSQSPSNVFISDTGNSRIREVSGSTGLIQTIAGTGTPGFNGDGIAANSAQIFSPYGLIVDPTGDVFFSDFGNARIREVVASSGLIQTIAGGGVGCTGQTDSVGDGCSASNAFLSGVFGIFVDSTNDLYIADFGNNLVREVVASGNILASTDTIQAVAGNGTPFFSGDGLLAANAQVNIPYGVAVDNSNSLLVADTGSGRIRRVNSTTGIIQTIAGGGTGCTAQTDAVGDGCPATQAILAAPSAAFVDRLGNLFISDYGNGRIRMVSASTGIISTVAGGGTGCTAQTDTVGDGCPATQAILSLPWGVYVDANGNIIFADYGNSRVREVLASTGLIQTIAGTGTAGYNGDNIPAAQAQVMLPIGPYGDASGNIFFSDLGNRRIREIVASTGNIVTVVGTGTPGYNGDNIPATTAQVIATTGIFVDRGGNLFFGDYGTSRVREVVASTGLIQTVAGNGTLGFSGDGGQATNAEVAFVLGVAGDANGNLFLADTYNLRVRQVFGVVPANTLNITTTSLPAGNVASPYSFGLQAAGGTGPYSWSITSGSLPPGFSPLSTTGVISGLPTAAGTFNFTVQVTDSALSVQSQALSLTINAAVVTLQTITVTPANPTLGTNAKQNFFVTGTYSDGSSQNLTSAVTWASGTTSVATITPGGVATGVLAGNSTITATLGNVFGSTALTVSANGPYAYIGSVVSANCCLDVLSTSTNQVIATIPITNINEPFGITPDQSRIYVADNVGGIVNVIDTTTNTLMTTIPAGLGATEVAITPNGQFGYVATFVGTSVPVFSVATNALVTSVPVGFAPEWVTASPDGASIYVTPDLGNNVAVINTSTNTVSSTFTVPQPAGQTSPSCLSSPVFNPTGTLVYFLQQPSCSTAPATATGLVNVFSLPGDTPVATISVGVNPFGSIIDANGSRLYVANHGSNSVPSNSVSVIDTATNTVIATVAVGLRPNSLALTPDGTQLYVTNGGDSTLSIIQTSTNSVTATIPLSVPFGITIATPPPASAATVLTLTPPNLIFGSQVIATSSPSQTITVTNPGTTPVTLTSIGLTGPNLADFTLTNGCPGPSATLAGGAACPLQVAFAPTVTGTLTALVTITSTNGLASFTQSAPLNGTATGTTVATFSGLTPSQAITGGAASISLAGVIGNGTTFPTAGEIVSITINGVTQNAAIGTSGTFSATFATSTIPGSTTPYTITYNFAGDAIFAAVTNSSTTLTVNVTVNPSIDLRIDGTDSPSPVLVNTNLTYTLVVQNNGQIPATGVTLTDTLPAGVTFVSATASQGTPCTGTATITCVLGGLASNATATITIVVTPAAVGTTTNNLIVTANEPSPIPANNIFHQLTDVVAAPNSNNARLNGSYAFLFNGFDTSGMMAAAGSFVADGAGNLTGGIADINRISGVNTSAPFTGTYNIGSDNRGTLTMNFGPVLGTAQFRVALGLLNPQGVATKGRMLGFGSNGSQGSGVIERQDTTAFSTAAIGGSFAFGASGADSTGQRFGAAGSFHLDGAGNLTLGLEDANTAGTLETSLVFMGTYNVASNGRGTSSFTFSGAPTPNNYAFYVVSANELLSISTDPRSASSVLSSSRVLKQVGTFSNSSFNGASVFNATGLKVGGTSDVSVGLFTADGAGQATLLSDENNGGTILLNQMSSLTYSVASSGRTTIAGGGGQPPILYLVDLNKGFLVGTDNGTTTGSFEPQAGGPFTNASISGSYFFGNLARPASGGSESSGVAASDGAGSITAIQDHNNAGQLFADELFAVTYVVSANGRAVLLGQGPTDTNVLYIISPSQAVIIDAGAGNSNGAVTIVEGSFIGSTDLAITETSAPNPVLQGATLTYSMTVTNNGPSGATGVTLTDTLPTGLTFVSANPNQGVCSGSAIVICSLGAIANGASAMVSIVMAPTAAGPITNSVSVMGNETDPNPANNLASQITTVIPSGATFTLTVTDIGTGNGTVTDNFALINCVSTAGVPSGTCSASYPAGTVVTLTATPTSPTTFAAWGSTCTGTGSCVVNMTSAQSVTASFTPPPQQINVTFNPGSNVSGMATYDCPSNPAPSPANPCTDPNAHALALAIPQVLQPFTLTVQASEIPPSVADGICPNGGTPSTDFDCRFTSFFSFQTLTNGDQVVPLCYPFANGNCVHYQVFSGTPGVEPNPAFYVGPIDWNITWNNDTFVPPAPYTGSTPRLYDDPDYAVSVTSPYGTDCTTPMLVGNPPAATIPPIFCQFEFDITTSFNPTKKVDAAITGRTRQFNDVVVAFPQANVGNLTVTETPLATPVLAGNPIGYIITVTNSAGGAVTGVTLTDVLPSGTNVNWTISPTYAGPGTCAISGAVGSQILSCAFGTISASQSFTIGLLSAGSSIGTYTDTATALIGTQQILSIGTLAVQGIAPTFSALTPSQSITAGTASINLSGTVGNGTNFISAGEPITITVNGVALSTSTGSNGSFSTTFSTANIPSSTTPYTISYSYAGDTTFTSATDTGTTLTVNPVVIGQSTLTVTDIGTGDGTVTDNFQLINCTTTAGVQTGTCSANYAAGAQVTLIAAPVSPSTFGGWGGACTGTAGCSVTLTTSQSVTASFAPPPQVIPVTFNPGTSVSGMATYNCPSNPAPGPGNPCTDTNAHAAALTIGQVLNPFTVTVQATEVPPSVSDGICPNGATPSTDFDCRFTTFFTFQTLANGDKIVPLCYPYANGNCVHYQVFSGTPGVEPDPTFYVGPVDWNISWNNDKFTPPPPYTSSTPRLYDDPDYAVSATTPYGTDCTQAMLVGNPPAATNPPIFCQFEFDITTAFFPIKQVDAAITGRTRQFNDVVVAFPVATVGNLTVTEVPLATPVAPGNPIGFTITVTNSPGGPVTGATLTDALPSGTNVNWTISPAYSGPGTCAISGAVGIQVLSCAFGTITASQSFTIGLQSPGSSIGTYTDTATIVVGTQQILSIGTLSVQGATSFTGLTPSRAIVAGTTSITLSGTIGSGTNYPSQGETVSVSINGTSQSATIGTSGAFSITFNTAAIPVSATPYTIIYNYTGDLNYTSASNTSTTLMVNPNNSSNLVISPSSIDFGQVPIGRLSVKNITLSNSGNSTITISKVSMSHMGTGNYRDYSVINHCPKWLAAGHNCSLSVFYSPEREIPFPETSSSSVVITDTAAGSPQSVPVKAQNINPKAKLSTNLLKFGNQKVGTTSAVKTVTLANVGTTPLALSALSSTGDFALDASTTCHVGSNLAPSQTCSLTVKFSPTKTGTRVGLLTLTDNAFFQTAFVVLAGTGQ